MSVRKIPNLKNPYVAGAVGLLAGFLINEFIFNHVGVSSVEDRISYAIGHQIGNNLKNQGVKFNPQTLAAALYDGVKGKSRMDEKELAQAMELMHKQAVQRQGELEKNRTAQQNQFSQNNQASGNLTTLPSGVQFEILVKGSGKSVKKAGVVKFNLVGALTEGSVFENTTVGKNQPIVIPVANLPAGIVEALMQIKEGGKIKAYIPNDLLQNSPFQTPPAPDGIIVYTIELLAVK